MDMFRNVFVPFVSLAFFSGCWGASQLAETRRDLEAEIPGLYLDREVEMSMGRYSLGFVRFVTLLIPPTWEFRGALRQVKKVRLAVYDVETSKRFEGFHKGVEDVLSRRGWEVAVRSVDGDERIWLFYRLRGQMVEEAYWVIWDRDDLVILHLEGHLDQALAWVFEEHGRWMGN